LQRGIPGFGDLKSNDTRLAPQSKPAQAIVVHCAGMILCKDRAGFATRMGGFDGMMSVIEAERPD
jgi:hypothetical protein